MQLTTSHEHLASSHQWPAPWVATVVAGALLLVFALDRATDSAPVQHLYYLPIILAGVRFKLRGGVLAGLSATLLYHAANPHLLTFRYEESDLLQIVLFLIVGVVAARLSLDADRLRRLASTDDLTGLHNLRSFEAQLTPMVRASREQQTPLAMLVLDVDRLKSLNDEYGHLCGAEAVRTVGRIIGERLPPAAVGCRYGGDEFVIAVPHCTVFQARRLADDLRDAVHDDAPVLAGRPFASGTLSISVGVVCELFEPSASGDDCSRDLEAGRTLFGSADAALYRAKAQGRNRVCVA